MIFVDEHENSIQQGLFAINHPNFYQYPGSTLWCLVSFPATRHNCASTVSFADGHAEIWHWQESSTLAVSLKKEWLMAIPQRAEPGTDRDLGRFFKALPEKVPIP